MNWNGEQLRILRELGHEPMLLASSMPEAPVAAASAAPSRVGQQAVAAEAVSTRAMVAGAALAAAIGRAAAGHDLSALALDLERLRREPALKRALWPQLRALRRGH
ncbi:MAG: hypothetical protein ABI588_08460 [Arenimonas sp.]